MKYFHDKLFDNGLAYVQTNGNKMVICKGPPATFAEANTLASAGGKGVSGTGVAMASGDFAIGARAGGGREITVTAKSGTVSDATVGTDDLHIAILNTATSELLLVTDEVTNQALTAGNPVNIPSFKFGFSSPV